MRCTAAVLDSVVEPLRLEFVPEQRRPASVPSSAVPSPAATLTASRLLAATARHEPTFAKEAEAFDVAAGFADNHIRDYVTDPTLRAWGAATIVDYLYGGICEWLDNGDPMLDDQFTGQLQAGARALVATWSTAG